MYLILKNKN